MAWKRVDPFRAAQRGEVSMLRQYLDSGGSISAQDDKYLATPLHWACLRGKLDAVALLIERSAPLEARTLNGGTPLTWACMEGHVPVIAYMLFNGADVRAQTRGKGTPLHHAASYGHVDAVR
ncbi:ankyrin repeat protein, partial [Tribonema minus]